MRKNPELIEIQNCRDICSQMDRDFLDELKKGLLLALKEQGILNTMQLRQAEKLLRKNR